MRVPELTVRQLKAFEAVALAGSFTQAAAVSHISQSVLSRTVQEVERALKVQLFDRTKRRVVLTAAGREFLSIVGPMTETIEHGLARFIAYTAAQSGTISIATLPSLAAVVLPGIIRAFLAEHPGVEFEIVDGAADQVFDHLEGGTVELGLTTGADFPQRYRVRPLITERMFGVVWPGHPWTDLESIKWVDFIGQDLIAARQGTSVRHIVDRAFEEQDMRVIQHFNASSVATIGGLIRSGIGVAALPALEITGFGLFDLPAIPIDEPNAVRTVGAVHPLDRELSPAAAHFLDFMRLFDLKLPTGAELISAVDNGPR